jgi:hypothetical protein
MGTADRDTWKRIGNDLFQLWRAGTVTPVSSLVDRRAKREEQLEQLASAVDWVPEQILLSQYQEIVGDTYAAPEAIPTLPPGSVASPVGTRREVLLLPGERSATNSLRAYLWPVLNERGELLLEDGEEVLDQHGDKSTSIGSRARNVVRFITSRRMVMTADLYMPPAARDDYHLGLGLISPTLMDSVAAFKQLSRVGRDRGRRWVSHLRYEWISGVSRVLDIGSPKKSMFGGPKPPTYWTDVRGVLRRPFGDPTEPHIDTFDGADAVEQSERLLAYLRRSTAGNWSTGESTSKEVIEPRRRVEERRESWTIDEGAMHSIPVRLIDAT